MTHSIIELAQNIIEADAQAAAFLVHHMADRQRNCHLTTSKTVADKMRGIEIPVTTGQANRILRLFEGLGLGCTRTRYSKLEILWSGRIDLFALASAIREKLIVDEPSDPVAPLAHSEPSEAPESTVICAIPFSRFDTLKATGLLDALGIREVPTSSKLVACGSGVNA